VDLIDWWKLLCHLDRRIYGGSRVASVEISYTSKKDFRISTARDIHYSFSSFLLWILLVKRTHDSTLSELGFRMSSRFFLRNFFSLTRLHPLFVFHFWKEMKSNQNSASWVKPDGPWHPHEKKDRQIAYKEDPPL